MYASLTLTALQLMSAPKIVVQAASPGAPVPAALLGSNLPARTETTARIPALLKSMGVSLYRYPGGSSPGWHWMTGAMDFPVAAGEGSCALNQPQQIVDFVRAASGQLLITTNLESGTPAEAAGLASELVTRGMRAQAWEIGNEPFGDWDNGYRGAAAYAADVRAYASALRAADPGARIGLDLAGAYRDTDTDGDAIDTADWDRVVLRGAGSVADFMSYHWYPGRRAQEEPLHVMAGSLRIPIDVARFRALAAAEVPGRTLDLAYLEWDGVFDNDATGARHTLANAIFYADALGQMMTSGVAMATHYDASTRSYGLVSAYAPCVAGAGFAAWDGVTVRPKAYALQLVSKLVGGALLPVAVSGGDSYAATTTAPLQEYTGMVPYLAAYAVRAGDVIKLLVVHRHPTQTASAEVELAGLAGAQATGTASAEVAILTGPALTSSNERGALAVAVSTETRPLARAGFTLEVPPRSVMLIELPLVDGAGGDGGTGGADAAVDMGGGDGGGCGCHAGGCAAGGGGALVLMLGALLVVGWRRRARGRRRR